MQNRDLAEIFTEIADILEIQEGNPFRIRSFRRAAQILESLPFNAAEAALHEPEKLQDIPGIGSGTLSKIRELAETGKCREHEELKAQIPPSLITLLQLQNLGPKKIALFWRHLNITNLEELERAAREQRLRDLPGMGEKSEQKILQAIQEFRRRQGRFRLDDGIEISEALIQYLKSRASVKRISAAGSVRRRKETIGDLDLLLTCEVPEQAVEAFVRHPDVREVLARGETKVSVRLRRGLQADLRVLDDESFGAALQYFTGSKEHNVELRSRAKRMNFKISEYGLFRAGSGQRVAGRDEEEIYRILGLDYIPPELRENRGEITAAEQGKLPSLIREEDLRGDLHMHTNASDGRDTAEQMAAAASAAGYEYIAITDHSKALAMTRGLDEERLAVQIEEIDRLQASHRNLTILKGIEVDILPDGSLDLSDESLALLDVVVASVHSRFNLTKKEMTRRICRALENPYVNILGHPTGRLLTKREPYEMDLDQVIRTAVENRVCLEINAYPERLDLSDVDCRKARDMGALLCINSDSHSTDMLSYRRYGVYTARRGWLEASDVLNTYPLPHLKKILAKETYR